MTEMHLRYVENDGTIRFRRRRYAHALVPRSPLVVTLFLTGPRSQRWGFYTPFGWVWHRNIRRWVDAWADAGVSWAIEARDAALRREALTGDV